MSDFIVGAFINHNSKQFSITARQADAPDLKRMIEVEKNKGFDFTIIASGITKQKADAFKACQIAAFENVGYAMATRMPIKAS